jgi:hypothetical protein
MLLGAVYDSLNADPGEDQLGREEGGGARRPGQEGSISGVEGALGPGAG